MTTEAYREGVADKEAGVEEPILHFEPGTKNYLEYALGYLRTQWIGRDGKREGGLDV